MTGKYDDIIFLSRHVSTKRKAMSMHDRAAQFSPFAALTGYEDSLEETARPTGSRIELDEHEKYQMDMRQQRLMQMGTQQPAITVTYYVTDIYKEGGSYVTISGYLKRIQPQTNSLLMTDGTVISLQDVVRLDSPLFSTEID